MLSDCSNQDIVGIFKIGTETLNWKELLPKYND